MAGAFGGGMTMPPFDEVSGQMAQSQNQLTEFLRRMFNTLCEQQKSISELRSLCDSRHNEQNDANGKYTMDIIQIQQRIEQIELDRHKRWQAYAAETAQYQEEQRQIQERTDAHINDVEGKLSAFQQSTDAKIAQLRAEFEEELEKNIREKKTIRETVDELSEQHNKVVIGVMRERCGRMRTTAWMLADLNLKGRIWRYFHKWHMWRQMDKDVRQAKEGKDSRAMQLLSGNKNVLRSIFFKKLTKFVKWAHKQHFLADRYRRSIRRLWYMDGKATMLRYWRKFTEFLAEIDRERQERRKINEQTADTLADISQKALMNRWLQKWIRFRGGRAEWRRKQALTDAMSGLSSGTTRRRYLERLLAFLKWRQYRKKRAMAADAIARDAPKRLMRIYLEKLAGWARKVRRELERIAVSRALVTKNGQLLRSEYWSKLQRFAAELVRQRERAEGDARFLEANRRMDNLGTQVDVSLKTLSNTNSVLNKLVDRLIAVDEQLDCLGKEKVGRRELSFITDPNAHPTLGDEPPSPPRRHADPRSPTPREDPSRLSPPPAQLPGPPPEQPHPPAELALPPPPVVQPDDRLERLQKEREQEQEEELQHARAMEEQGDRLERIVHSLAEWGDPTAAGLLAPTPPARHAPGITRPLVTPPAGAPPPPGRMPGPSPSSVDSQDYAYHYTSEFQRQLAREQAQLSGLPTPSLRPPQP